MASPHDPDQSGHPFMPSMSQPWGHSTDGMAAAGTEELRQLWSMVPNGGTDALAGLQGAAPMGMLETQVTFRFQYLTLIASFSDASES